MGPECTAILALTSCELRTPESISEAKSEYSGSEVGATFFVVPPVVVMALSRSFRVRNSSCSKRPERSDSVTPLQARPSMLKSKGAS